MGGMADHPLLGEARALREYWALRTAPVYRGVGVPLGDQRRVLVLPGLFGNDLYLQPLRTWLRRIGYRPVPSKVGTNAGCPKRLVARVEAALAARLGPDDVEIAVVGHSRGGMLGKALVTRLGKRCTRFVALGSPVGGMLRAGREGLAQFARGAASRDPMGRQSVVDAGRAALKWLDPDCETPLCGCDYIEDLFAPWPNTTRVTSIYSTDDPVVSPHASVIEGATNIPVTGTHGGLVVNKAVYPHLARALARRQRSEPSLVR